MIELGFHGAAGEVTGSCYCVRHERGLLLVECGLFQGGRDAPRKNLAALDFDLRELGAVLLTHAHLDHAGLVPRLVALGYKGLIYATAATVDLLRVLLLDAAYIQEKEAEWLNRHRRARHIRRGFDQAPLYTVRQAEASLARLRAVPYDQPFSPAPGVMARFQDAGHILGSAILSLDIDNDGGRRKLVFSGDLGQRDRPVLPDPSIISAADYLCVESTYGDRNHRSYSATIDELVEVVQDTLFVRGGNVVIPAFAVGRTQELLFLLADLVRSGRLPHLEIFVDSPMATRATELTLQHAELWDEPTRELQAWLQAHPQALSLNFVADAEASKALNARRGGAVILSASGMCEAGRIKYHLYYNLPRPACSVVIAGFQAAGTLGRRLVDGARQVTLFGERIPVHASVHTLGGLSAHADQASLLAWLAHFQRAPRRTFVVHGESGAAQALATAIRERLDWPEVVVPARGDVLNLP